MKETPHSPLDTPEAKDCRCQCGNLMARVQPEGVELKCRRCKRTVMIPWQTASAWHGITVQWQKSAPIQGE